MALNRVDLGIQYFPQFAADRAIANAQIFVGQPNLDPQIVANQIQAYVVQEDGTQVAVPQPIRTGSGGVPTYNGSPVQVAVDEVFDYSIKVLSLSGSQIYYIPSTSAIAAYITNASGVIYTPPGSNTIVTTAQRKLEEFKSLFDFTTLAERNDILSGLMTLDHTTAVQTALASGENILFPMYGKIRISDKCDTGADGQVLWGVGGEKLQIVFDNTTDPIAIYGMRVGMINVIHDGVEVHGLYLDNNFRNSGRVDGDQPRINGILKNTSGTDFYVHDCTVWDYYGDGISQNIQPCDRVRFHDNLLVSTYVVQGWTTAGTQGQQSINVSRGNYISIKDNILLGALDDAIAIHGGATQGVDHAIVSGNIISTTGGRILVSGCEHVNVNNNIMEYIQSGSVGIFVTLEGSGVPLENRSVSITDNNIIIETGVTISQAIRYFGGGGTAKISDNTVYNKNAAAGTGIEVQFQNFLGVDYGVDGIVVSDNYCRNLNRGINISDSAPDVLLNMDIRDNTLHDCTTGINLAGVTTTESFVGYNRYINCTSPTNANLLRLSSNAMSTMTFSGAVTGAGTTNLLRNGLSTAVVYKNRQLAGFVIDYDVAPTGSAFDINVRNASTATLMATRNVATGIAAPGFLTQNAAVIINDQLISVEADPVTTVTNSVNVCVTLFFIDNE